MAPTASYNIYDDEVNELDRNCSGNGSDAGGEVDPGTPVRDRQQSLPTALEAAAGAGREGYIYFLETSDGKYIKIGFSNNPVRRLWEQKLAARLIGFVPGTREVEQWLHKRFASDLAHRKEWFHRSSRLEMCIDLFRETETMPRAKFQRNCRSAVIKEESQYIHMFLEASLVEAIDKFRWEAHIKSRAEAIRILIQMALDAWDKEKVK